MDLNANGLQRASGGGHGRRTRPPPKRARVDQDATRQPRSTATPIQTRWSFDVAARSTRPTQTPQTDDSDAASSTDEDVCLDRAVSQRMTAPHRGIRRPLPRHHRPFKMLDFDFEKLCCGHAGSNINVYACLVCGASTFRGAGRKSQGLLSRPRREPPRLRQHGDSKRVYVLPEGYEVHEQERWMTLNSWSIRSLGKAQVMAQLDRQVEPKCAFDLEWAGKYIPGFVGMNNIKANDFFNVVVHALAHVPPLSELSSCSRDLSEPAAARAALRHPRPQDLEPAGVQARTSRRTSCSRPGRPGGRTKRFTLSDAVGPRASFPDRGSSTTCTWPLGGSRSRSPGHEHRAKARFRARFKIESQQITARADANDRLRFEDTDVQDDRSYALPRS